MQVKWVVLTIVMSFVTLFAKAQTAKLSGQILNYPNQLVRIYIGEEPHNFSESVKDSTLTDANGYFSFDNLHIRNVIPVALVLGPELASNYRFVNGYEGAIIWMDKQTQTKIKVFNYYIISQLFQRKS
jgi:hypothetical protein